MEGQFKNALPPQIDAAKFTRVVMTAIQANPDLLSLDRNSLWASCMKCASDGLLPDGREAALVKFKDKVAYLPMYNGVLKKVRNSGELSSISAQVVYSNDEFDYWVDETGEHLKHKPKLTGERGEVSVTYAIARTKDGAVYVEVMNETQMTAVRKSSRASNGPWDGPFIDEMRKKTAIKRLAKRLPSSTDLETVLERDNELYDVKNEEPVKIEAKPQSSRLAAIVDAQVIPEKRDESAKTGPENVKSDEPI